MFIVVVLPQPDGPRSAMNDPCGATRLRSCTALSSPKCFVRFSRRISAMLRAPAARLPLDRAEREAADEVALDEEPEERRRDDQDAGERRLEPVLVAGRASLERLEVHRRGGARVLGHHLGDEEVRPVEDEDEERCGGETALDLREDCLEERTP